MRAEPWELHSAPGFAGTEPENGGLTGKRAKLFVNSRICVEAGTRGDRRMTVNRRVLETNVVKIWLPKNDPVTKRFGRNRFEATTKDFQPRRFPSRRIRCGCSVIKDQTAYPIISKGIRRSPSQAPNRMRWPRVPANTTPDPFCGQWPTGGAPHTSSPRPSRSGAPVFQRAR